MKIAIVGTGISGLVCAHLLHPRHQVTVFEANDYIGGHTHTVSTVQGDRRYEVDTGFIVFNEPNYPNFVTLLRRLDVATQPAPMSFSVRNERSGLEYCGTNLNTVFAQRRNLLRPQFYGMLREILRFNRVAKAYLQQQNAHMSLSDWLALHRFSQRFQADYLLPMGAAIWSARPHDLLAFPARTLLQFFDNHQLLTADAQLPWRSVKGGSERYVQRLVAPLRQHIRLSTPVRAVERHEDHVQVRLPDDSSERFERVILATHSDQALGLLADPSPAERAVLGAIPYQRNEVVLHTDASLLPRSRRAWAAWNYHVPRATNGGLPTVTYNMNLLQSLDAPEPFCVTLNRSEAIAPEHVLQRFEYDHPVFNAAGVAAQRRWPSIDGRRRTHFCGAYWGYGFHEDGVRSALAVCNQLDARL